MKNTERFSNRVDNYVKYRPGYPKDTLRVLAARTGYTPQQTVADIGSGTGISTALFLDNGNKVYGVEPNTAMREKAEELLKEYPGFISLSGTAEKTGLPDASVDLIAAGQAFHWFDPAAAAREFSRIGIPGASIALIWNERQINSPFEIAYEGFLLKYASDYKTVNHKNITREQMQDFFHPQPFHLDSIANAQVFDWEGLKGRFLSSSYIPLDDEALSEEMLDGLKKVFNYFEEDGFVRFDYLTQIWTGRTR